MRIIIYISGILGGLLLMIGLIGTINDFNYNAVFLISGLALIVPICIPLMIVDRYRYNKKIDHIIKTHKDKPSKTKSISPVKSKVKGWGMNNSPFRERKSGLTWGGGNIKGANASRGTRKSFLK
ncbi:MAG: hypothetical protein P1P88_14515 [Bacteroidales bacterium]|nr:hypothetical protein [Bacteroidales bacterium]